MRVSGERLSNEKGMEDRIDKMFAGDKLAAGILVAGLWLTVFFVMFAVRGFMPSSRVELVCWPGRRGFLWFIPPWFLRCFKHFGKAKRIFYPTAIAHFKAVNYGALA